MIGLYIAYVIPIYLRWRMGDKFEQAESWNLGRQVEVDEPDRVIWVAIICIAGLLPSSPPAVPWDDQWDATTSTTRRSCFWW